MNNKYKKEDAAIKRQQEAEAQEWLERHSTELNPRSRTSVPVKSLVYVDDAKLDFLKAFHKTPRGHTVENTLETPAPSVEDELFAELYADESEGMDEVLSALSEYEQELLVAFYVEGLSYRKIAENFGYGSHHTAKAHIQKACAKLVGGERE